MSPEQAKAMINPQRLERLSLYLQALGVDAPLAKKASETLLRDCMLALPHPGSDPMKLAMGRIETWKTAWVSHADAERYPDTLPLNGEGQLALAIWQMRQTMTNTHASFTQAAPDESQSRAMLEGCWPVVPPRRPTAMPRQSFGNLPSLLRRVFWRVKWQQIRETVDRTQGLFIKEQASE